jgi:hypothetical protein
MLHLALARDESLCKLGKIVRAGNATLDHAKEAMHELRLWFPAEQFCGERIIGHVGKEPVNSSRLTLIFGFW